MSDDSFHDEEKLHYAHFENIGEAEVEAAVEGGGWSEDRALWGRKWLLLRRRQRKADADAREMETARNAASAASRAADAAERAATAAEEQAISVAAQAREARQAKWIAIVAAATAIASVMVSILKG